MTTQRQIRFIEQVAEAAREAPLPRGRPTPANLTDEGRMKGLQALRQAPRCRSTARSGSRCKNPSMRGSTRCVKHGGRVEVPNHPHNIRRFMTGKMHAYYEAQDRYLEGKAAWEAMSWREQRELLNALPDLAKQNERSLFAATLVWRDADVLPFKVWNERWSKLIDKHC